MPVFVVYSLLIWALLPMLATLAVVGLVAVFTNVELPLWAAGAVAGLATAAWVSWGVGYPDDGITDGLILGAGVVGATLVLGNSWRRGVRLLAATGVAAAAALVAFAVLFALH
ncbi:hypothetical protein ACNHYB_12950 [Isoptericola jiangsuensis]|uniref:hypothetical protein n=1 Tax=Isoptericola jiangsuensis TaxID=548579 RepID=UPI003AABA50F